MKKLRLLLSISLFVVVLAYTMAFASANSDLLALDFLLGLPIELPVSVWLGVAVLFGILVGLAGGLLSSAKHRLTVRQLKKNLADTQQRLNKLP